MATPRFFIDYDTDYGVVETVRPGLRRVTAHNPSRFTFRGTGTYIVGFGEVAVIDPGPADGAHISALLNGLRGERVVAVLVTHTHSDHSPGVMALAEHADFVSYGFDPSVVTPPPPGYFDGFFDELPDPPTPSSSETGSHDGSDVERETVDLGFSPDVVVSDGARIEGEGWSFEALHTPGHMSNHVSYAWAEGHGVFTGDHVMGWSTTVIPAPDGDLNAYMASLERLGARDDRTYWPTHGAPIDAPQAFVHALADHRRARSEQILGALAGGTESVAAMVAQMYAEVPIELWRPASLSVLAHLIALAAEDRVVPNADPQTKAPTHWALR